MNVLLSGSETLKMLIFNFGKLDNNKVLSHCSNYNSNIISVEIDFMDKVNNDIYKYSYFIEVAISTAENKNGYIKRESFKYKKITSTGPISTAFERENTAVNKIKGSRLQQIDGTESLILLINKIKDIKDSLEVPIQKGIEGIFLLCNTPVLYSMPDIIRESIKKQVPVIKNGRIVSLALIDEIDKTLKSSKAQYYNEILKDILDIEKIDVINIGEDLKNLIVTFSNGQENTINELSDGTLIALNIVTYLISNKYPVIAIEEIENSLHPKLLKKMINVIKNDFSDIQVILTTNSPVILNMVKTDEVSVIHNDKFGGAIIEQVKNNKELIKKLSGPFSSFSDIFFYTEV